MKRIIRIVTIIAVLIIVMSTTVFATDSIKISVNGTALNFDNTTGIPFIDENNRTQVPLRIALEKYGAKISWIQETMTAVVIYNDITIQVPIGEKYIIKNGEKIATDSCALIKNEKTYLPIRPVAEAIGAVVSWNSSTNSIEINQGIAIDEKYNTDMLEQESNKSNYGVMVYDKNYQYFIVKNSNYLYSIVRKSVYTGELKTLIVYDNNISRLAIHDNCLYYIEYSSFDYTCINKFDLRTHQVECMYKQTKTNDKDEYDHRLDDFTIYDNTIYYASIMKAKDYSVYYDIGVVNKDKTGKSLFKDEGLISCIYAYNSKLYINSYSTLIEYDLQNNDTRIISDNIYSCTFNKNMLYYSDYDNKLYSMDLNSSTQSNLIFTLDRTKFPNEGTFISCLNMHNGKLYFVLAPDWMIYTLGSDGKPVRASYIKGCTEYFSVYGDTFIYQQEDNRATVVGGPNIKVAETPTLDEYLAIEQNTDNKYYLSMNREQFDEAVELSKKSTEEIVGCLFDKGYILSPASNKGYNAISNTLILTSYSSIALGVEDSELSGIAKSLLENNNIGELNIVECDVVFVIYFKKDVTKDNDFQIYLKQDGRNYYTHNYGNISDKNASYYTIMAMHTNFNDILIDYTREFELTITYGDGSYCTYIVNLSDLI